MISLSDHFLLSFSVDCTASKSFYKTITYRNMKKVNNNSFIEDLMNSLESITITNDFGKTVDDYNTKLANLMDKHAPKTTREVKIVESAPWFDSEYRELRKQQRKAEKKYKRTDEPCDKETFKDFHKETTTKETAVLHFSDKRSKEQTKSSIQSCQLTDGFKTRIRSSNGKLRYRTCKQISVIFQR